MADKPTSIVAAILLGCVGVFAIMAQPILVEVLVAKLGMDSGTAGRITAVEALGTALGPLLALGWTTRVPWRVMGIAALTVVIGGNLVSAFETDTTLLIAVRFLVGLFGEGTAFALAMAIVGGSARKDRNFALLIAAQVLLGVCFFLALPLPRDAGVAGVMLPLAGLALLALLTVGWIPQPQAAAGHGATAGQGGSIMPALQALGVLAIWCTGLGALWAFVKLIGLSVTCPGCDEAAAAAAGVRVGQALGLSTLVAVAGALAAAALADRFGRILPVTIALGVQLAMVLLLQGEMPWMQFTATVATFQVFWNLAGPYMMGTVALNDTTGRVSLLIPTAQIGGFFFGPILVGTVMTAGDLSAVNRVSAVSIALALVLFIPVARRISGLKGGGAH